MRYVNKETNQTVEAIQWKQNGDHPLDNSRPLPPEEGDTQLYYTEGAIVRRFVSPDVSGDDLCDKCGRNFREHGWVEKNNRLNPEEWDGSVCPGDYIATFGDHFGIFTKEFVEEHFTPAIGDQSVTTTQEPSGIDYGKALLDYSNDHLDLGKLEFRDVHPSHYDTLKEVYRLMNNGRLPHKRELMTAIKQAHGYLQGAYGKSVSSLK